MDSGSRLSAVLITKDAAATIGAALNSLRFASEIIVVDTGSSDGTLAIAKRHGARIYRAPLKGFGPTKNLAISKARRAWILSIDADETVPQGLRREIADVIGSPGAADLYSIPRRNFYFGRWLRFGGKYPDRQRRLFRRGHAHFLPKLLHERMVTRGATGTLDHPLDHHPYPDLTTYLRKLDFYARHQALALARNGARPSPVLCFRYLFWLPLSRFASRFVLKGGFLDGLPGFLACVHDALTHVLTYAYLSLARSSRDVDFKGGV